MRRQGLVGKQLDEYRIVKLIGEGGMARVYLATDVRLKRKVAIKVIKAPMSTDIDYAKRFEREAQAAARLEHPHIIRLYRYGEVNGTLYMAMQYLDGSDLKTLLATYRHNDDFMALKDAIPILENLCSALDYAHSHGVIHRDVKPSNIILDNQGRAYLSDFGLARLSNVATHGKVFGSVHYMAPEQAISSAATVPQSDLYAAGVILYEILTGQPPFNSNLPSDIALQHMSDPPRPPRELRPEISREIEVVVLKMLAKQPDQRYAKGADFIKALKHAVQGSGPSFDADMPTLVSRASLAQRLRQATVVPLPPVPAVVLATDTMTRQSPLVSHDAIVSKPRGIFQRKLVRMALFLGLIAILALLLVVFKPDSISNNRDGQDSDRDGITNSQDRCPESAGLAAAGGCIPTGTIQADRNVNLRSGPNEGYKVVARVYPGDTVEVLGRSALPGWLYIRIGSMDLEAWVYSILVKTDVDIDALPIIPEPTSAP